MVTSNQAAQKIQQQKDEQIRRDAEAVKARLAEKQLTEVEGKYDDLCGNYTSLLTSFD